MIIRKKIIIPYWTHYIKKIYYYIYAPDASRLSLESLFSKIVMEDADGYHPC